MSEVLPKPDDPRGSTDVRFLSPQPDTSLHYKTPDTGLVYHAVRLFTFTGIHCMYPHRDGQAELTRVAGYIPRWFTRQQTVQVLTGPDVE